MSLLKKLAGQTIVYGAGSVLGKVLHFVFIAAFLSRKFRGEQELFGIYTELYFYAAVLLILYVMRMETALFRFGTNIENRQKAFSTSSTMVLLSSSIGTVVLLTFSKPLAHWIGYPGDELYVQIFAVILFFDALMAIPFAHMRLEGKAKRFAGLKLLNVFMTIIFLLFFLEFLPSLERDSSLGAIYNDERRLLFVFLSNLMASLGLFLFFLPQLLKIRLRFDKELLRSMINYVWPLVVVAIAGVINQSVSAPLQKYFLPHDLLTNQYWVGIYGACLKLAILLSLVTTAYNYAAEPFFFKRNSESEDLQIYSDATRAYGVFASLVIAFTLIFLPYLRILIDSSYWDGLFIVAPMLFAFYLLGLYYNFSIWYKLKDKTLVGALLASIGALITFVISIVLLPRIGIVGSVYAALGAYGIMSFLCLVLGHKHFPVPYPLMRLLLYPVFVFTVFFLIQKIELNDAIDLSTIVIRTGTFLGIVLVFFILERPFLKRTF